MLSPNIFYEDQPDPTRMRVGMDFPGRAGH